MERLRIWWVSASALGLLFGCEVSEGSPLDDDAGLSDSGMLPDGAVGDGGDLDGGQEPTCAPDRLLLTAVNWAEESGDLILFDPEATADPAEAIDLGVHLDTVTAALGCQPLVLERDRAAGTIRVQSESEPLVTVRTIDLKATPSTYVNPQAVIGLGANKAYVVPRERNEIQVIDPTREGTAAVTGSIDLSAFVQEDDVDGNVEPTDAIRIGNRVYVALSNQYLDESFQSQFTRSLVVVIDANSDEIVDMDPATAGVQAIALQGNGPSRGMIHDAANNRLLVGVGGSYTARDGGIEAIDLATGASAGIILAEENLGEIGTILHAGGTRAFLRMSAEFDAEFMETAPGGLRSFSLSNGDVGDLFHVGTDGAVLLGDYLYAWIDNSLARFSIATGDEDTDRYPVTIGDKNFTSAVAVP